MSEIKGNVILDAPVEENQKEAAHRGILEQIQLKEWAKTDSWELVPEEKEKRLFEMLDVVHQERHTSLKAFAVYFKEMDFILKKDKAFIADLRNKYVQLMEEKLNE